VAMIALVAAIFGVSEFARGALRDPEISEHKPHFGLVNCVTFDRTE
jgi:hypothetical protein